MIYLSGAVDQPLLALGRDDVGLMVNQHMRNALPRGIKLGADNSCIAIRGGRPVPRADWDPLAWIRWLATLPPQDVLFAVAPDVLADAQATYKRALSWFVPMRHLGLRIAYVLQDGCTEALVPWDEGIGAVFVGGSDAFKTSEAAYRLCEIAARKGLWRHMGRVNGSSRLFAAAQQRFDSCDGTWLAYGPDANRPNLLAALNMAAALERTPGLFGDDSAGNEFAAVMGL